ncbi:hypothetical protein PTTG_31080, partial [Puccinia triticina 1-1 BBBD Race 1]
KSQNSPISPFTTDFSVPLPVRVVLTLCAMSRPYGTPVGQDQGYSSPGNYNGHPQSGQRGTNYSTPTEIYPMGTSPGAWMNPQLSAGRTPMAHPIHGALPQASDCSHGHSASPRDLHSL